MGDNQQAEQPDWRYYFQTPVLLAEEVTGGYANDVWHVPTEGGDYIVKITKSPPRPERHFWDGLEKLFGLNIFESITKRKGLAEFLQQHTHLRLPDIYYVEREDAKIDSPHMVMERLPGEPLDLEEGEARERQARELGERLEDVAFDRVITSDLPRAERTAELAFVERQLAIATSELLRERNWGIYDGKKANFFRKEARDLIKKREKLTQEEQWSFKFHESVESNEEIFGRFMTFILDEMSGIIMPDDD